MTVHELKEKAHALPLKPGVNIKQAAKNGVTYGGRAQDMKNRGGHCLATMASHTETTRAK